MLGNQFHSFSRKKVSIAALAASSIVLASCSAGGDSEASAQWREATSVEDGGGMDALIEAAQAEGSFNVMGLYEDWANYGELLKVFGEKYDIEINNDVSSGSSQDLVNAVKNRQGQDTSLDYLDTGMSFAEGAKNDNLLAEYYPETVADIDDDKQSGDGTWYNHLGGNMAFGCDAAAVEQCPTEWEDLLSPEYHDKIAISGDPTSGESGFMTVLAASLAIGGSLDDIQPGLDFFSELSDSGNLLPVEASAGTIETGETPIVIDWDYLLAPIAEDLDGTGVDLQISLPSETVSSYYAASINDDAPHPAVARLWFEFLFSDEGQNLLLDGYVKPVRLQSMIDAGTVDQDALDKLPEGSLEDYPQASLEQRDSQHPVLVAGWGKAVG
ncbi:ABC transporter substrate-binding protein [Corynebacterium propinquum]|uniref:ABC transporter substrate-binding protein n=1 Tax=Corynebacterium propinquum TaxID=43769 RepID=UPI00266F1217|nr:ABC transporter substrate-binding protein [Corynebacterium propinquum]WKS48557.1 ABC transporter substrate-binding protein [Corynebacterium propinquum]